MPRFPIPPSVCRLWPALALPLCLAVAAQPAAPRPDPLDPRAEVPPLVHRSAFAGERAASSPGVGDWKAANERVARIGGWRSYAREAQAPASPASAGAAGR